MIEKVGEKCGVLVSFKKRNLREVLSEKKEREMTKGERKWEERKIGKDLHDCAVFRHGDKA